jgi:hypothetical protein
MSPEVWTVIGVWLNDKPIVVGMVRGEHRVYGDDSPAFEHGHWAVWVRAVTWMDAATLAEYEMRKHLADQ